MTHTNSSSSRNFPGGNVPHIQGLPRDPTCEACYCPDFQRCDAFSPDYVQQALGVGEESKKPRGVEFGESFFFFVLEHGPLSPWIFAELIFVKLSKVDSDSFFFTRQIFTRVFLGTIINLHPPPIVAVPGWSLICNLRVGKAHNFGKPWGCNSEPCFLVGTFWKDSQIVHDMMKWKVKILFLKQIVGNSISSSTFQKLVSTNV